MQIVYQPAATKALLKMDKVWAQRIRRKMREYAANPLGFTNIIKRLAGDGRLRLRIGDYRVLFTEDGVVLMVDEVGHRREVYRRRK